MKIHQALDEIDPIPSRVRPSFREFAELSDAIGRIVARDRLPALRIVGELARKCAAYDHYRMEWADAFGRVDNLGRALTDINAIVGPK